MAAFRPSDSAIACTKAHTVLLPFVPVTATTGARAARANSSTSPRTGTPRSAAADTAGSRGDTPGLSTSSTARSNHSRSNPPSRISAPGSARRASCARGGDARLSESATSTPCACR